MSISLHLDRTPALAPFAHHPPCALEPIRGAQDPSAADAWARALMDAFEAFGCGAILLFPSGRVDRLNRSARNHLGRGLVLISGELKAPAQDDDLALRQLIRRAVSSVPPDASGAAVVLPRRERRPLVIQARQFASWDDGPWRTALILIDPDKPRAPNGGALGKAFGL